MELAQRSYKRNYTAHWLFLALLTAAFLFYRRATHPLAVPTWTPPAAPAAAGVDWFYVLKMPEISTQYESGIDTMKVRMTEWLNTLKSEGFHPMLLSDVLRRLQKGEGLPERTVVTFFSPGYRRTYESVGPILSQLQWPAVWLTDDAGLRHADRRFVTYHTARQMEASGLWDIGFDKGNGRIRLENSRNGTFNLGSSKARSWNTTGGAFAINHGAVLHDMNFLSVNPSWLSKELLNRLYVETPPSGDHVYLTKGLIQGREWGLTIPGDRTAINPQFDIKAPLNRRGTKLFFLGTQACPNFRLHIKSDHLVGEFWTQLRVDDVEGYAINVIHTDKAMFVVQQVQQAKSRLFFGPQVAPRTSKGFSEDLILQGQQLTVAFNGGQPILINDLRAPVPGKGILQIYIADKPHGTARADAVTMEFTPLPPS